jgi:hypothetical protein
VNTRAVLSELREIRRSCDKLIEQIETEPRPEATSMIDQTASDLGPKRHCAVVRRRIYEDKPGALIIGRRHLLSPEAYAEESGRRFRPPQKAGARIPVAPPGNDNGCAHASDEVRAVIERLSRKLDPV